MKRETKIVRKKIEQIKKKLEKEAAAVQESDTGEMFEFADEIVDFGSNEEMKILRESQKDLLQGKDPKQHHWYPRPGIQGNFTVFIIKVLFNTSNLHNAKVPQHQYELILTVKLSRTGFYFCLW